MNQPLARRIAGITLAALGTVSLAAACGGSGKAAAPTGAADANGFQTYLTCLSQHGVTLPSRAAGARPSDRPSGAPQVSRSPGSDNGGGFGGGGGGGFGGGGFGGGFTDPSRPPTGVDAATWSAAVEACKSVAPTTNPSGRGGGFNNSAFTAYRNCLSDHGVTITPGGNNLSTTDPKVAAALKACEPLRPTGRPSGAPSATG